MRDCLSAGSPGTGWRKRGDCEENGRFQRDRDADHTPYRAKLLTELVEAITDPEPNSAAWIMDRSINGGDEIGDACNNTADILDGVLVQAYWSQFHRACVIPFGTQLNVIELRLQGSWIQADLSAIVSDNPPAVPAAGNPFAYVTSDSVPRIVYRGVDKHIHELRLQGSWIQADLSAMLHRPLPRSAEVLCSST